MHPAVFLPFFSTLAGGFAALRLQHRLHALMALAAGRRRRDRDRRPPAGGIRARRIEARRSRSGSPRSPASSASASWRRSSTSRASSTRARTDDAEHVADRRWSTHGRAPRAGGGTGLIGLLPPISLVIHSAMDGLVIGLGVPGGRRDRPDRADRRPAARFCRWHERRDGRPRGRAGRAVRGRLRPARRDRGARRWFPVSTIVTVDPVDARAAAGDVRRRVPGRRRRSPAAGVAAPRSVARAGDGLARGARRGDRARRPRDRSGLISAKGRHDGRAARPRARSCRSWCRSSDVDRAADFYEHVLGLPLLFKYPGNAFFDADGVRLYLAAADRARLQRPRHGLLPGRRRDRHARAARGRVARPVREPPDDRPSRPPTTTCGWPSSRILDGNNIGLMREAPKGPSGARTSRTASRRRASRAGASAPASPGRRDSSSRRIGPPRGPSSAAGSIGTGVSRSCSRSRMTVSAGDDRDRHDRARGCPRPSHRRAG